jgi:hypothetical protein
MSQTADLGHLLNFIDVIMNAKISKKIVFEAITSIKKESPIYNIRLNHVVQVGDLAKIIIEVFSSESNGLSRKVERQTKHNTCIYGVQQ